MRKTVGGEDLGDLLEMRAKRREMLKQIVCYRGKGETWVLNLEEKWESEGL